MIESIILHVMAGALIALGAVTMAAAGVMFKENESRHDFDTRLAIFIASCLFGVAFCLQVLA